MSTPYFEGVTVEGLEKLALYHWGDRMVNHWFCPTCGIHPFADAIEKPGIYRVNLGCLDDFDASTVELALIDGAAF